MSILHRGKFELFPMRVLAFLALAVASIVGVFASDTTPSKQLPPTAFQVARVRIHDADTISGDVLLPWGVALTGRSIRAAGFDAWEVDRTRKTGEFGSFSDSQWNAETERGIKARDELKKLAEGGVFYVEWDQSSENSVYGRLEGSLWVRTSGGKIVNVKQWAEQNGHVRK